MTGSVTIPGRGSRRGEVGGGTPHMLHRLHLLLVLLPLLPLVHRLLPLTHLLILVLQPETILEFKNKPNKRDKLRNSSRHKNRCPLTCCGACSESVALPQIQRPTWATSRQTAKLGQTRSKFEEFVESCDLLESSRWP